MTVRSPRIYCPQYYKLFSLMCKFEVCGDFYRGCSNQGHFVPAYYTGGKIDCQSPNCANSDLHTHPEGSCRCPAYKQDERRIRNLFHFACESCRSAEFTRRVGR
ncbi:hypothetical protein C8J56DRAFT_489950 [Mycena floridula]|nr:hypothetical protein C8J56DRAFT_489950 [Mycena floridula]